MTNRHAQIIKNVVTSNVEVKEQDKQIQEIKTFLEGLPPGRISISRELAQKMLDTDIFVKGGQIFLLDKGYMTKRIATEYFNHLSKNNNFDDAVEFYDAIKPKQKTIDLDVSSDFYEQNPDLISERTFNLDHIDQMVNAWHNIEDNKFPKKITIRHGRKNIEYELMMDGENVFRNGHGMPSYRLNENFDVKAGGLILDGVLYRSSMGLDELIERGHFNPSSLGINLKSNIRTVEEMLEDPLTISLEEYAAISIKNLTEKRLSIIPVEFLDINERSELRSHFLREDTIDKADDVLRDLARNGLLTDSIRMNILITLYDVDYIDSKNGYKDNLAEEYLKSIRNIAVQTAGLPNVFERGILSYKGLIFRQTDEYHEKPKTDPFINDVTDKISHRLYEAFKEVQKLNQDSLLAGGRKDLIDTFIDMKMRELVPGATPRKDIREELFPILSKEAYNEIDNVLLSVIGENRYQNLMSQLTTGISLRPGEETRFGAGSVSVTDISNIDYEANTRRVKMIIRSILYPDYSSKGVGKTFPGTTWSTQNLDIEGALIRSFILASKSPYVAGPGSGGGTVVVSGKTDTTTSNYLLDQYGNRIIKKDDNGNKIFNENGNPVYETFSRDTEILGGGGSFHYTARRRTQSEKIYDHIRNLSPEKREEFLKGIVIETTSSRLPINDLFEIRSYKYHGIRESDNKVLFVDVKDDKNPPTEVIELNDLLNKTHRVSTFTEGTMFHFKQNDFDINAREVVMDARGGIIVDEKGEKIISGLTFSAVPLGHYSQIDTIQFGFEISDETKKMIVRTCEHLFVDGYSGQHLLSIRRMDADTKQWTITENILVDNKGNLFKVDTSSNSVVDLFNGIALSGDSAFARSEAYANIQKSFWNEKREDVGTWGLVAATDVTDVITEIIFGGPSSLAFQTQQLTDPEKFKDRYVLDADGNRIPLLDKENNPITDARGETLYQTREGLITDDKKDRPYYEEQNTLMFRLRIKDVETQLAIPISYIAYNFNARKSPDEISEINEVNVVESEKKGANLIIKSEMQRFIFSGTYGISKHESSERESKGGKREEETNIFDFYTTYDLNNPRRGFRFGTGVAVYSGTAMEVFDRTEETYEFMKNLTNVMGRGYFTKEFSGQILGLYFLPLLQMDNNIMRDAEGNPIFRTDDNGNLILDENDNPIPMFNKNEFLFRLAGLYKWSKESETGMEFDFSRVRGLNELLERTLNLQNKIRSKDFDMTKLDDELKKLEDDFTKIEDTIWQAQSRIVFDERGSRITVQFNYNETQDKITEPGVYCLFNHRDGFVRVFLQPVKSVTKDIKGETGINDASFIGAGFGFGNAFRFVLQGGAILGSEIITERELYDSVHFDEKGEKKEYMRGFAVSAFFGYSQEIIQRQLKTEQIRDIDFSLKQGKVPQGNEMFDNAIIRIIERIEKKEINPEFNFNYDSLSDGLKRFIANPNDRYLDLLEDDFKILEQLLINEINYDLNEFKKSRLHSFGIGAIYLQTHSKSIGGNWDLEDQEGELSLNYTPIKTEEYFQQSIEIPMNYSVTNALDAYIIYRYRRSKELVDSRRITSEEHSVALGYEQFSEKLSTFGELAIEYTKTTEPVEQYEIIKKMHKLIATFGFRIRGDNLTTRMGIQGFLSDWQRFNGSLDSIRTEEGKSNFGAGLFFTISY